MNTKRRLALALATVAAIAVAGIGIAAADPGGGSARSSLADAVQATAHFHDLDRAKAAGYGLFKDAQGIACIEMAPMPGMAGGAMGIHYVKGALVGDGDVNASTPEASSTSPRERADAPRRARVHRPQGRLGREALVASVAVRAGVQLHAGRQPIRAAGVLLAPCVDVEEQPAWHVLDVEPGGELRRSVIPAMPAGRRRARLFGPDLGEMDDRGDGGAHVLNAGPLALAVVVVAAGEDVRRRQPLLGEPRAVGAAADAVALRLEPVRRIASSACSTTRGCSLEHVAHVPVLDSSTRPRSRAPRIGRCDLGGEPPGRSPCSSSRVVSKSRRMQRARPPRRVAARSPRGGRTPRAPSVVSGESRSLGRRAMKSAASLTALIIFPFACRDGSLRPTKVSVSASALNVSSRSRRAVAPSSV